MKQTWLALIVVLVAGSAYAIDAGHAFDDPQMQTSYEKITSDVLCLVCHNQTIKESNAFLADYLRREIR